MHRMEEESNIMGQVVTGIDQGILKRYFVRQRAIIHHGVMSSVLVENTFCSVH